MALGRHSEQAKGNLCAKEGVNCKHHLSRCRSDTTPKGSAPSWSYAGSNADGTTQPGSVSVFDTAAFSSSST